MNESNNQDWVVDTRITWIVRGKPSQAHAEVAVREALASAQHGMVEVEMRHLWQVKVNPLDDR